MDNTVLRRADCWVVSTYIFTLNLACNFQRIFFFWGQRAGLSSSLCWFLFNLSLRFLEVNTCQRGLKRHLSCVNRWRNGLIAVQSVFLIHNTTTSSKATVQVWTWHIQQLWFVFCLVGLVLFLFVSGGKSVLIGENRGRDKASWLLIFFTLWK